MTLHLDVWHNKGYTTKERFSHYSLTYSFYGSVQVPDGITKMSLSNMSACLPHTRNIARQRYNISEEKRSLIPKIFVLKQKIILEEYIYASLMRFSMLRGM